MHLSIMSWQFKIYCFISILNLHSSLINPTNAIVPLPPSALGNLIARTGELSYSLKVSLCFLIKLRVRRLKLCWSLLFSNRLNLNQFKKNSLFLLNALLWITSLCYFCFCFVTLFRVLSDIPKTKHKT